MVGIGDAAAWRSLSSDPKLLLQGEIPWSEGTALLFEADVLPINGCSGKPALYFDLGGGFDERYSVTLAKTPHSVKPYSAAVRLDVRPKRIRFDPCEAVGDFLCSDIRVSAIPPEPAIVPGQEPVRLPRSAGAWRGPLRLGAIVHLHYEELWPELAAYLDHACNLERLFVSVAERATPELEERIAAAFPFVQTRRVPNRGRDMLPFLDWLEVAAEQGVDLVCKVHSKRSPHVTEGDAWRRDMLGKLLGSEAAIRDVVASFLEDPRLGIVGPAGHVVPASVFWERNAQRVSDLCRRMGDEAGEPDYSYIAGSMFWARVDALLPLKRLALREEDFEPEAGEVDGTLAHALERCIPVAAKVAGFRVTETERRIGETKTVFDFAPLPPGIEIPATMVSASHASACGNLDLVPVDGIEVVQGPVGSYRAVHGDPQFRLEGLEAFRGRWVRLRIEMSAEERLRWNPSLYFDTGSGFSQETAMRLPPPERDGGCHFILQVPHELRNARFDPIEYPCEFRLGVAEANDVTSAEAAAAMIETIERFAPEAASLQVWRKVIAECGLASDKDLEFERLNAEYHEVVCRLGSYLRWIELNEPPRARYGELAEQSRHWPSRSLVSVVMPTYNTREDLLRAAIESVLHQVYPHWELCIADDASTQPHVRHVIEEYAGRDSRIKACFRTRNGHIAAASNSALELATGEFAAFLDHDDALHPLALHYVAEAINRHPGCELLYSDEDKLGQDGIRRDPYFKCDLNPELLLAHNLICHLATYRLQRLREVGGLREGYEGAQDYDLALRMIDRVGPGKVVHIPHVLYHWRIGEGSTALSTDEKPYAQIAAQKGIADHLARCGLRGRVVNAPEAPGMNRVVFDLPALVPKVTIIVPTRDRLDLLRMCVESVLSRTTYPDYELLIVDNGSVEPATLQFLRQLPAGHCRVIRDESPFNFAALNNLAARAARGEFLCLLNNDIEVLTPEWLEEMMRFGLQEGVGAVGARLWFPDGRLQHGGVILGIGGVAGHSHKGLPRGNSGYFGRAVLHHRVSAVTAACLLVRKSTYLSVGGLDEKLQVAFNDIDFCLRVREEGLHNVWTPYAELIHHESATRGYETTPEKKSRFEGEVRLMQARWRDALLHDPAYSVNLSLEHEDFSLRR